jgi:hypothetical protein
MPEVSVRELLHEWRALMDSVITSAASAAVGSELPHDLVGAMRRQLDLMQDIIEGERRLQKELTSRLVAPVDAAFDLLEEAGSTMRRQAEALEAAGRALQESAGLMKRQAELFEQTISTLRQPAEFAKAATGLPPRKGSARARRR